MDTKRIRPVTRTLSSALLFVFALCLSACALFSGNDPGVRTPVTVWSDDMIEYRTDKAIKDSDPRFESSHIVVVSHSGIVTMNAIQSNGTTRFIRPAPPARTVRWASTAAPR